jgi:hypothetical protein
VAFEPHDFIGVKPLKLEIKDETPLKWPYGQERTLIDQRKSRNQWRKTFLQYRERLEKQLAKLGIEEAMLSYNRSPSDRKDPGVALYLALPEKEDYSWQAALGINNPTPTAAEINDAFKSLAKKHHPDAVASGSGGDVKLWPILEAHKRRALAWIEGKTSHDFCIAVDRCTEVRWNVEAVRRLLMAVSVMDEYGNPGTLERTFRGFKTALPAQASEATNRDYVTA